MVKINKLKIAKYSTPKKKKKIQGKQKNLLALQSVLISSKE